MRRWAWAGFALACLASSVAYFTSDGAVAKLAFYCPVGLASALAVLLGVRWHRPASARAWQLIATGIAVFATGDLLFYGHEALTGTPPPYPWWSDVCYLACYAFLIAGLARLSGPLRADRAGLIDAAILVTGVGLPMWVFLIVPYMTATDTPLLVRAVSAAYPLADLAVLGVVARMWFSPSVRTPAVVLLGWCAPPLLVSDVFYGIESLRGTWATGTWVDAGWLVFYVLPAVVALHPSLADAPPAAAAPTTRLSPARLVGLVLASLVAPGMLLAQDALGRPVSALPVAAAFVLLTALVLARSAHLASALASTTERERSQARFQGLVQSGSDLITLLAEDGTIRYQSPSSQRVLGLPPQGLVGVALASLVHPQDRSRLADYVQRAFDGDPGAPLEVRLQGRSGWCWVETLGSRPTDEDGMRCLVLTSRDVSERKGLEDQLTSQALHDPLTGLANRRLFHDRVTTALAARGERALNVLFIDLDDFKTVNDSLGHGAGDVLLTQVAHRLSSVVRGTDTVARLGGDEFAILLDQDVDPDTPVRIADRLIAALAEPVLVQSTEVRTRASIGIAPAGPGDSGEDVLRNADLAMYMAKGSGKGRHATYQPEMYAATVGRLELLAELRRALTDDELRLHYQPTVDLVSGVVTGVEALVRWEHPTRGLLSPFHFVPLAEESGLVVPLGRWVLERACLEAASWPARGEAPPVSIAVNISTRHLSDPAVVEDVRRALDGSGLDPARLVLEITETGLAEDTETVLAALQALKGLGVRLAVDDFGTGYSSLSYLRRFPIDVLKVDKSFVDGLGQGGEAAALVSAILSMARSLSLRTVAEGIEEADQLAELTVLGCDSGQGYLLSRPVPPERMRELLADGLAVSAS